MPRSRPSLYALQRNECPAWPLDPRRGRHFRSCPLKWPASHWGPRPQPPLRLHRSVLGRNEVRRTCRAEEPDEQLPERPKKKRRRKKKRLLPSALGEEEEREGACRSTESTCV